MRYVSTRGLTGRDGQPFGTADAIYNGLADDGGLYVPIALPKMDTQFLADLAAMADYADRAAAVIGLLADDFSKDDIAAACHRAYDGFSSSPSGMASTRCIGPNTYMLDLSDGKTLAFKDYALQLLPHLMNLSAKSLGKHAEIVIPVATSGDTGKAAMEAFADVENTRVVVFFPDTGVSPIQKQQMVTQSGGNVMVCPITGNFDDAQSGVKAVMSDPKYRAELLVKGVSLSAANSINWGRIMPQIAYYFSAYCDIVNNPDAKTAMGQPIDVVVPSGNFGNILAAYYAREIGLPIGKLVCASNQNRILTDFIKTGVYDKNIDASGNKRAFTVTSSPSMDILISSNLERFLYALYGCDADKTSALMADLKTSGRFAVEKPILDKLQAVMAAEYCTEAQTFATIKALYEETGVVIDPHTAVAENVGRRYRDQAGSGRLMLIVSTASPYKFPRAVLQALGLGQPHETEGRTTYVVPEDEYACLRALSDCTGTPIPKNLADLQGKAPRFTQVYDTAEIRACIDAAIVSSR